MYNRCRIERRLSLCARSWYCFKRLCRYCTSGEGRKNVRLDESYGGKKHGDDQGLEKEENLPISSGGTGHSIVAGLDSFPSVPMNRPSPRIVQTMKDMPEEDMLTILSKKNL